MGAKVTASFDDGTSQRIEITAGAGYLSQSPPVALFGVSAQTTLNKINVRWPNGSITTVEDPSEQMDESGKLRITQPTNGGGKHFPVPDAN